MQWGDSPSLYFGNLLARVALRGQVAYLLKWSSRGWPRQCWYAQPPAVIINRSESYWYITTDAITGARKTQPVYSHCSCYCSCIALCYFLLVYFCPLFVWVTLMCYIYYVCNKQKLSCWVSDGSNDLNAKGTQTHGVNAWSVFIDKQMDLERPDLFARSRYLFLFNNVVVLCHSWWIVFAISQLCSKVLFTAVFRTSLYSVIPCVYIGVHMFTLIALLSIKTCSTSADSFCVT